jgi:hypothetical protein
VKARKKDGGVVMERRSLMAEWKSSMAAKLRCRGKKNNEEGLRLCAIDN